MVSALALLAVQVRSQVCVEVQCVHHVQMEAIKQEQDKVLAFHARQASTSFNLVQLHALHVKSDHSLELRAVSRAICVSAVLSPLQQAAPHALIVALDTAEVFQEDLCVMHALQAHIRPPPEHPTAYLVGMAGTTTLLP